MVYIEPMCFSLWKSSKNILLEEKPTIDFANTSVVTIKDIKKDEIFSEDNIWVKRPGTGEIRAANYHKILHKKAKVNLSNNYQLKYSDIE